jgi:hypothetical protein
VANTGANVIGYMAVGTGSGQTSASTGLAAGANCNALDSRTQGSAGADNDVVFVATWAPGDATMAITEAGVFQGNNNTTLMLYDAPRENIKTVTYNISEVSPAPTAGELELTIKKFIPEAKVTYKADPMVMEYYRNQKMKVIDDTRARKEWGWKPLFKNLEEIVADFIQEVRTRPKYYGLA